MHPGAFEDAEAKSVTVCPAGIKYIVPGFKSITGTATGTAGTKAPAKAERKTYRRSIVRNAG